MRSVPLAMTWETFRHGLWPITGALLISGVLPAIIIAALRQQGGFDPLHSSGLVIHLTFMQISTLILGAAIIWAQGRPSRLYTFPIRTPSIVAWHFIPGMLLMVIGLVLVTSALNWAFQLGWPLWGPALFGAVAFAWINAMLWLTEKSSWMIFGLTLLSVVLGFWNKSRYGALFAQPSHFWLEVTVGELATMLGASIASYGVAVFAVDRNRRGDVIPPIGLVALIVRVLEIKETTRTFSTAARAQLWCEWRQKGWVMPAVVVFALAMNGLVWLICNRDFNELYPALVAGGGVLTVGGLILGVFAGNMGARDSSYTMGSFYATRPFTDSQMARIVLKMTAQSILLSWSIWLVVLILVRLTHVMLGNSPTTEIPGWWYFPATLLGPWIAASVVAAMGMTGRAKLFLQIYCGLMVAWIAISLLVRYALTDQQLAELQLVMTAVFGLSFIGGTVWLYFAAWKRSLVESGTTYMAAAMWLAGSLVVAAIWPPTNAAAVCHYLVIIGALAIAVLPFASTPLAVAWNRTR